MVLVKRIAFYVIFIFSIIQSNRVSSQAMLKRLHKENQKINASLGFRAGEPMGINLQFFKGVTATTTKSKSVIDILVAKEGAIFSLGPSYKNGKWKPGGNRFAISWFHEVSHTLFGQYLYYGIGVQAGSRKYQRLTEHFTEKFAWGPQLTLHAELPVKKLIITPQYLYCKLTLFAEVVYHKEVNEDFSYLRPAGGLRLNFFY